MSRLVDLDLMLPGLRSTPYSVTSDATPAYNCVSWAVGETHRWWEPSDSTSKYWPAGVPRDDSVEALQDALATVGFTPCDDGQLEPDFVKLAIFADDEGYTHVARQLPSGRWTSKLGRDRDIEHELHALTSHRSLSPSYRYGEIVGFMQRPREDGEETEG